jgi:hypothetical protein
MSKELLLPARLISIAAQMLQQLPSCPGTAQMLSKSWKQHTQIYFSTYEETGHATSN